jgi:hypothetical protein
MYLINARDITSDFLTSLGGLSIGQRIDKVFQDNSFIDVSVSFEGIENISPSFVNGAFLYLIDLYGEDYFRKHVRVVKASPVVAEIIRSSVNAYTERQKQFYEKLKLNKVFLASDGHQKSHELVDGLKTIFLSKKIQLITPFPDLELASNNQNILLADVFIAVAFNGENAEKLGPLLKTAVDTGKPCLLLVSRDEGKDARIPTRFHDQIQVMYFGEGNFAQQLRQINELVMKKQPVRNFVLGEKLEKESSNTGAWLLVGLAAALLLGALVSDKEEKN